VRPRPLQPTQHVVFDNPPVVICFLRQVISPKPGDGNSSHKQRTQHRISASNKALPLDFCLSGCTALYRSISHPVTKLTQACIAFSNALGTPNPPPSVYFYTHKSMTASFTPATYSVSASHPTSTLTDSISPSLISCKL
jgi:hypothetical protein